MIIAKSAMKEVLRNLSEQYRVIAPMANGKIVDFLDVPDPADIVMDDSIAYKSPKEFFFPRCEKLLSFCDGEAVVSEPEKAVAIFGVRPCDLEALDTMSKIFLEGKFKDPFFAVHLEQNLLIGVGCREKNPGCFCEKLSVDQGYSDKCDLFLRNLEDSYEVGYVSEKGREKLSAFLPELKTFANAESPAPNPAVLSVSEDIDWKAIAEICQGCGMCTFICPTCHCFDFQDVEEKDTASRYRIWDSCMYPKFTLHASGHNPRETTAERFRQRMMHKYVYVPQNVGKIACTGCGRCVRSCPAGMDIRRIMEEMT